jgi:hypothetical protein
MHVSVRRRLEPAQSLPDAPAAPLAAACAPLTLLLRRPRVQVCERCRPGGCPYWRQRTRRGTRGKRSGGLARSSNGRRRATKVSSGPRNPSVVASDCAGERVRAARGPCAVRVLRGSAALRARGVARSTCFTVIVSNVCHMQHITRGINQKRDAQPDPSAAAWGWAVSKWYVYTNVHLRHCAPLAPPRPVSVGPNGQYR